ncbi:MAG: hypothetical protein U0L18_04640 [Acutalibacteraceae bacterium]|nr:hypothetical protein [Acutalibacteraceae bacterium]
MITEYKRLWGVELLIKKHKGLNRLLYKDYFDEVIYDRFFF